MTEPSVMIMAGGTGGHIVPGLAVANAMRERGFAVVWMGSRGGMEEHMVRAAKIELDLIPISGVRGKGIKALLLAPFQLLRAVGIAMSIIGKRKPAVVVGFGGFVAGPGGLASWLMRKPLVIHESNAIAGSTNTYLAKLARRRLTAFPDVLPAAEQVGNPVRASICALGGASKPAVSGGLNLLIVGGSRGALALNQNLPQALREVAKTRDLCVWHQCGERWTEEARACYQQAGVEARVDPFITDMAQAYQWADLVVCRAGAMTVSELACAGKPSLLVPFPYAIDDHQTANAMWLVRSGAAEIIQETEITSDSLSEKILALLAPEKLQQMSTAALAVARPESLNSIVDLIEEVAHVSR